MIIITPDNEESEAEALIESVKGIVEDGGNLIHLDVWGKRRLAYPIQKRSEGYYAVYVFECEASFVAQLNQSLRVIEAILRHMVVLFEDDIEKLKAAQEEETAPETADDDSPVDSTEAEEDSAASEEDSAESEEDSEASEEEPVEADNEESE